VPPFSWEDYLTVNDKLKFVGLRKS
jgi:hypothetical protein